MIAIANGHPDVVETLIEAGADVNQSAKVGVCVQLLYSISAHTVVPWFVMCLTMDSLLLYMIKHFIWAIYPLHTTHGCLWLDI